MTERDGESAAPIEGTKTRLDQAVLAARMASEAVAADAAAQLIDALLTEALICPVWPPEEGEAPSSEVGPGSVISPMFVEHEGQETLPLFDTEERLAAFVNEPTEFVAAPGRAFFELAAREGVAVALNPEVAETASVFAPEAVAAIAEAATETDEALAFAAGDMAAAHAPTDASEALLAALAARVAAAQTLLAEAWLVSLEPKSDEPRLLALLALPTPDARDAELDELAAELSRLGGVLLGDGRSLDVGFLADDAPLLAAARTVGVGLRRMSEDGE